MGFQERISSYKNAVYCYPWKFLSKINLYNEKGRPIKFVTEDANWAIKSVGFNIKREMDNISPNKLEIVTNPSRITKKIVHFGSQYMWLSWGQHMSRTNKFISTFFHGKPEDGYAIKRHIDQFRSSLPRLSKVITASSLVEKRLLSWDVNPKLITKIPLGVNTKVFLPAKKENKTSIRKTLKIPKDAIVIGSFQKDGIGWGNGIKPKLIKGPDIFVNTLKILSKKGIKVFALLTGPARGYVIENLKLNNIPYYHSYVNRSEDLVSFYQALDIYLITSREEGGPMGLMESISCGIPVVSTNVGMAGDVITNKKIGSISSEIDSVELAQKVENMLNIINAEGEKLKKLIRKEVLRFDWQYVAEQHWSKVYKNLI